MRRVPRSMICSMLKQEGREEVSEYTYQPMFFLVTDGGEHVYINIADVQRVDVSGDSLKIVAGNAEYRVGHSDDRIVILDLLAKLSGTYKETQD